MSIVESLLHDIIYSLMCKFTKLQAFSDKKSLKLSLEKEKS